MSEYGSFAYVYDSLMSDVDYKKRTKYLSSLFKKYDRKPKLLLDVACGTGGFSIEFAKAGVEVIGVDMSDDMLAVAREKSAEEEVDVLYLCQKAEELDLYGTVDGAICCLDSLNHIIDYKTLKDALCKVSLFLEEGRLFIFDVNSVYKHREILGDNNFIIEQDDIYCVWQNEFCEKTLTTNICLDFFAKNEDETYERSWTEFSERAYTSEELEEALSEASFKTIAVYADLTEDEPEAKTDRLIYITRKKSDNTNGETY